MSAFKIHESFVFPLDESESIKLGKLKLFLPGPSHSH